MKGKAGWAWEVWSKGASWDPTPGFVAGFKDKGAAQARVRRLRRSHPETQYFLKHSRLRARMKIGPTGRRHRAQKQFNVRVAKGSYAYRPETYSKAKRDPGHKHYWVGQRAQMPPHTDAWMMGDRYGTITKVTKAGIVWIRLDKSGRTARVRAQDLHDVFEARDRSRRRRRG